VNSRQARDLSTHLNSLFVYAPSGTIRDAVAAGSVVVDGTDRTPLLSTQGTIERDAAHSFTVYR
jgi:hypothetical protein